MSQNLLYDYFINPIISPELFGYNIVNTVTYLIILIIMCGLIYLFLEKKIKFDEKFFLSLIPYIIIGVSLRTIMHQIETKKLIIDGIIKTANPLELGFWFFTPGVWIITFLTVIIGLIISNKNNKLNHKKMFVFGGILATPLLLINLINFNNWVTIIITLAIILLTTIGLMKTINKFTNYKILINPINFFIILGQGIDGIASSIAITFFNFSEQHVFSNILIQINPLLFIGTKLILGVLICFTLDDYLKEEIQKNNELIKTNKKEVNKKLLDKKEISKFNSIENKIDKINLINFVKLVIAILGMATGTASLLKLGII